MSENRLQRIFVVVVIYIATVNEYAVAMVGTAANDSFWIEFTMRCRWPNTRTIQSQK